MQICWVQKNTNTQRPYASLNSLRAPHNQHWTQKHSSETTSVPLPQRLLKPSGMALYLCFLPLLQRYPSHCKLIFAWAKVYTKCHSSVLMDVKPIGNTLDSQRCGKDSAAFFKTLVNLYGITTKVLKDYSIPESIRILKKWHRIYT